MLVRSCQKVAKEIETNTSVLPAGGPAPGERAVAGKESARLGAVSVSVTSARVGKARWMEFNSEVESRHDLLILRIEVSTKDKTKKIQYRSWRKPPLFAVNARVWDNFGNSHIRLGEGIFGHFREAVETATVTADEPALDTLLFDKPLPAAEYLDLDLPGDAVGLKASDMFRFRIPKEMWAK